MSSNTTSSTARWLSGLSILLTFGGFALAFSMLAGPLGVWLGLWNFGQAFSIMGTVYPFTWIAAACIAAGAIVLHLLLRQHSPNTTSRRLFLPLVASAACLLAWYIPSTFQPASGEAPYPPIHDVSTDVNDVPDYVAVLPLRKDAPNTVVYGGSPNMTAERNAELQLAAFPDLVTKHYQESTDVIFNRALSAVDDMDWELVDANAEEGRIEATATTFWLRFKDDVVIRIKTQNNETLVDARSLSRVGGGDAGANAKRLRKFFDIL